MNHKVKCQAQQQGRQAIRTSGFNPTTTVDEIREASDDSELAKATEELVKRSYHYAANVPGNKEYVISKFREMVSTNFVRSYVDKKRANLFHTGSQAEYHEYGLRRVLSAYISNLDIDTNLHIEVMDNDAKFVEAARSYIHVVTHYFAAKSEIWFALVMKPVHGVKDVVGRMEFTEGRGAIHGHWLGEMKNRSVATWEPALQTMAGKINVAR